VDVSVEQRELADVPVMCTISLTFRARQSCKIHNINMLT